MDRRLSTIASQIENGIGLADVGTDHGFLPVHLARHGYTGNLYASDINEGPLRTAVDNANQFCLIFTKIAFHMRLSHKRMFRM